MGAWGGLHPCCRMIEMVYSLSTYVSGLVTVVLFFVPRGLLDLITRTYSDRWYETCIHDQVWLSMTCSTSTLPSCWLVTTINFGKLLPGSNDSSHDLNHWNGNSALFCLSFPLMLPSKLPSIASDRSVRPCYIQLRHRLHEACITDVVHSSQWFMALQTSH